MLSGNSGARPVLHCDRVPVRHPVWHHFCHSPKQRYRPGCPCCLRHGCQHSGVLVCPADAVFLLLQIKDLSGTGTIKQQFFRAADRDLYVLDSLLEGNPVKAMDALRHLILPGIVLAAFTMGLITRTTRSNLLDALSTDYSRTAKAKELGSLGLIIGHALGNALIPVMTVIGLGLGNLLGGMVLVETIFKWPGVGQFAYESVMTADYPAIIGVALLIALNYMIINTVVDILYGIIDPRVRCSE